MNILLSESLDEAIRRRAEAAGYPSPNAYVEAVVRADLDRTDAGAGAVDPELSPETRAAIQEGLESGPGVVADEAFWAARYGRLAERRAGAWRLMMDSGVVAQILEPTTPTRVPPVVLNPCSGNG